MSLAANSAVSAEAPRRETNASSVSDPIEALAKTVYTSAALDNDFYDLWTSTRLTPRQIAIFARNYGEFNRSFPEILSVMISHTQNIAARTEYAKTLFSEMGYGNVEKVHSVLFCDWLAALGEKMGDRETLVWKNMEKSVPVLPETRALIDGERDLYSSDNATGSGAQLALEWQAYTMLRRLYDGATLYKPLWKDEDEFHESCEYFYAHIGATEKEHKIESLNGAREFYVNAESLRAIEDGFTRHLTLFANFWNAIGRAMRQAAAN
ncbi:iron-containing redox enzyme family protein [Bradyrhizobium sp. WSM 1704]|uniref:iron-containing redox enzyme family protein n=1 Tax=Bradyrhizobium semiaridum TaxID=2821404 RepID=UPI001CE286D9|nr:iron-containing redox enzyme family protein [Bradyrhizobium semiaridum]MCA6126140.1 iron-containing redox enzyme family protein [Bradyrhizobium semiaridum]